MGQRGARRGVQVHSEESSMSARLIFLAVAVAIVFVGFIEGVPA